MASDKQRREVARKLRVLACTPDEIGITEHAVISDLCISAGIYDDCCKSEDVLAVADLIDRQTCRICATDHEYEDSVRCDRCRMTFRRPWEPFKYCPNCGAVVI